MDGSIDERDGARSSALDGDVDHVLGVGGSGMMPLALLLAARGRRVSGADRSFDRDPSDPRARELARGGVRIRPQDEPSASGARVIVSTAIEPGHPALAGASRVVHRAAALAELVDEVPIERRILVAGSSGKTTTTAMIGWILAETGRDPFVYVGGEVAGLAPRGARWGTGPAVVEVDESDGSIARFTPGVAVLTSATEDHKPIAEIERLFRDYLAKTRLRVVSEQAAYLADGSDPVAALTTPASPLLGAFNRVNEALAVAAAAAVGVSRGDALAALGRFPGVGRRLEFVRRAAPIVIDDFAHNPEKIMASLAALRSLGRPLCVVFQPHGYGPTRMHARAFGAAFGAANGTDSAGGLGPGGRLLLLPIHDAGGTADRSIRAEAILEAETKLDAVACPDRATAVAEARRFVAERGRESVVVVMGARDPSLATFARTLAESLAEK